MKVLIEFAHPALQKSRVNKSLISAAAATEGITVNDLYENYPDFHIDVPKEQQLLLDHDVIVFQHPFYWYSCPALLKEWQDLVLEHGFAYGSTGSALKGKIMFSVISTGGNKSSYQPGGHNQHEINSLLLPFSQTANLCGMTYLAPFLVQGTHSLSAKSDIPEYGKQYQKLLKMFRENKLDIEKAKNVIELNSLI